MLSLVAQGGLLGARGGRGAVEADVELGVARARDLGERLGAGGHLTSLRRTRIGGVTLEAARSIDALEHDLDVLPLSDAVRRSFPGRVVSDDEADAVRHGRPIELRDESGPVGVFDGSGRVLALMEPRDEQLRVVVGFVGS